MPRKTKIDKVLENQEKMLGMKAIQSLTSPRSNSDPHVLIPVEFNQVVFQTPEAWKVVFFNSDEEIWCPKSICALIGRNEIMIPRWLIQKNNLV